ncbi:MAG: polyhydroxyalkanoate synthase [Myxococcota bacterium]|jgi:polyhydroxyalkanoate synthase
MIPTLPDPLASMRALVEDIGGLRQVDQVRRGMWLHANLPRPPIGMTPHRVVHTQNKLTLRCYEPTEPIPGAPPVVVVPSMINRASICDLEPDRSLVGGLAQRGHRVYLLDWGCPGPEDAEQTVAHVLLNLFDRAVRRACRDAGSEQVFLLGYCQGGTLAGMYTALRPQRVRGLAVFNAPFLFSEAGRFHDFVAPEVFDVDTAIDPSRLMPTDVMKVGFKLLDPMGNWTRFIALDKAAEDPARLARTLARERWLEENIPMPGAFAQEFIRNAYQEDRLMRGGWVVAGEEIRLSDITCPVLCCAAERDFIAPKESVLPLADAVGSTDTRAEVLPTGHIGVVVGSFGPRVFYPLLDEWFRSH